MKYYILQSNENSIYCRLGEEPQETSDKCFKILKALSIKEYYPDDATFSMHDYAGGLVVADYISNSFGYTIISGKFKKIIDDFIAPLNVEFLPLTIVNHKGRNHPGVFYILNMLDTIECVDLTKSVIQIDEIETDYFHWIEKLVLSETRIPENCHIFRLKNMPKIFLVSELLKTKLIDNDIKGVNFIHTGTEYDIF